MNETPVAPVRYADLPNLPRLPLAEAIPLPHPLTLYLELCGDCNLQCYICPQSNAQYRARNPQNPVGRTLPLSLWRKLRDEIVGGGWKLKSLNLWAFGEPLLHPDLVQILQEAHKVSERVTVSTNGLLLDRKTFAGMMDAGLDYLRVSVWPNSAARLNRILRERRLDRDIRGTGQPWIVAKCFSDEVRLVEAPHDNVHTITGSVDEVLVVPKQSWDFGRVGNAMPEPCCWPFYAPAVRYDGTVSACCTDWTRELQIGDLRAQTLAEIWSGPAVKRVWGWHLADGGEQFRCCWNCDMRERRDRLPLNQELARSLLAPCNPQSAIGNRQSGE